MSSDGCSQDLHVHLDGSIRIATLIDLAKEIGMELPSYDPAELKRLVFKDNYGDLTVRWAVACRLFA